ncbi:MFS transporter [Streptomyces cellulosae]|uniref:Major facilitator superfamily (MFS) profile domain-containing protein n=1 Tax=Streptomyces cellulosae TaxID=1968 RepID=A0ABW7YEG5_STRCE
MTLYLKGLRGWSSLRTALALVITGCDAVLAPTLTPKLVARFGNARVIVGGFALVVVAYGMFLRVGPDWPYPAMLPTLFLAGSPSRWRTARSRSRRPTGSPTPNRAWRADSCTPPHSSARRSGSRR